MAEDEALLDLLRQFKHRRMCPLSTLGFFTIPFLADHGPYHGLVVKIYRGVRDQGLARGLLGVHDNYVRVLSDLGLPVPETHMSIVRDGIRHYPIVLQEPFHRHEILRDLIAEGKPERCVDLLLGALDTVCHFWDRVVKQEELQGLGLHASIRNFGYRRGRFWHLDTFPPMFGLSREEMHDLILQFGLSTVCRLARPLALPFMDHVTGESYSREKSILGLVGSVCRLRPECSRVFLQVTQQFVDAQPNINGKEALLDALGYPPRLSVVWVTIRRLLGKGGEPNVSRFVHPITPTNRSSRHVDPGVRGSALQR